MIDKKETTICSESDLAGIDTGACLKGLSDEVKDIFYIFDDKNSVRVGRQNNQDLTIQNACISSQHCLILKNGDNSYSIMDLDSKNGVLVNGIRVELSKISNQDIIQLGPVKLIFYTGSAIYDQAVATFKGE